MGTVLKGIMFRMVLIGYPQMTILCLWEFTQVDSPAEVVLAIFFFFGMTGTLAWAALKVVRIAKRSEEMHKNPAYILYSADFGIYPRQGHVHCFRSKLWNRPSYRLTAHRGNHFDWSQCHSTMDGQEHQQFQYCHLCC